MAAKSLTQIIKDLKSTRQNMKAISKNFLSKNQDHIIAELKAHSPYDTGEFSSNWKYSHPRFTSSKVLAGILITNDTPYAYYMVYGAEPLKAPWYYPHRNKKTGRFRKGTGKLRMTTGKEIGRVWAGGLNPGHDKTVGGVVQQVFSKYLIDKLYNQLADEFAKGLV